MKKIAYFSNTDFSLYNFRLKLMKEMKNNNFVVYALSSKTDSYYTNKLSKEFLFTETPLKRNIDFYGRDFLYFIKIFWFCVKNKPDICHNFTIKPCIYGALAQRLAGVKKIYCTITGLGYAFENKGLLQKMVVLMYKISLKRATSVIFQNPDDRNLFISLKIINQSQSRLIKSSGVDTRYFSLRNTKKENIEKLKKELKVEGKIVITLISRMLYQKGIKEFVEAAQILHTKHNNLQFLLVGPIDAENPSGIKIKQIEEWHDKGVIMYLKQRKDIREILSISNIFTLPSVYKEGVPKILLEAGAMELPLITTNVPGCKEAVEDGINGFLVKHGDSYDLANKIEELITSQEQRKIFGKKSREIIKRDFIDTKIVTETVKTYNL